jgi:chorismate mutase
MKLKQLDNLRKQIDTIDESIVSLLAKRMKIVQKIGIIKKRNHIPSLDQNRWNQVLETLQKSAKRKHIPSETITRIWNIIHEYALRLESTNTEG